MRTKKSGVELIAIERKEQLEKHGRSRLADARSNNRRQLRYAAHVLIGDRSFISDPPIDWSPEIWEKMKRKPVKQRLIIAGALIAAELDRINKYK